jgi:hypothetical protein
MKTVPKRAIRLRKCEHCGKRFAPKQRGRPQLFCKPSHRVRAREKRRELEYRRPSEKLFRLLKQRLDALWRHRVRATGIRGMDEFRRFANLPRRPLHQNAVESVHDVLVQLAPELFQDLAQPWRGTISAIEADHIIDRIEDAAPWPRP